MNNTCNTDAGKNLLWPGATPYFGASIVPKSLRASEVAPGHSVFASQANLQAIPRPYCCQSLPEQTETVPRATQAQARRTYATTKAT
jgi:hypothetical protein